MERIGGVEPHSAQLGRLATHLVLTRTLLKYTNDIGNWISLSNRTNFGSVF